MTHEDPEISLAAPAAKARMSRRGLLRGAGGIGIAGVAAGMLIDTTAGAANPTISHSFPSARRRLVSQPSPMTRDSPGEIALRGEE